MVVGIIAVAAGLYALGRAWKGGLALGVLLSLPAVLFAVSYLHVLDSAAWYYNLRAIPYVEWAGAGERVLTG